MNRKCVEEKKLGVNFKGENKIKFKAMNVNGNNQTNPRLTFRPESDTNCLTKFYN